MADQAALGVSRKQRLAMLAAAVTSLVILSASSKPAASTSAAAPAEDAGEVVVVAEQGSSRRLSKGGSATEFSLRLPDGASCPGDSANDNYRVQSYMVPSTANPAEILYDGLGPVPFALGSWATFRQPLYETGTSAFTNAQTANANAPGEPGPIVNIPPLFFGVYGPGELPPGRYNVGIACSLYNQPVRYWNTEVVLVASADDEPSGITWNLPDSDGPAVRSGGLGGVVAGGGLAVALAVAVYARRRLRPRTLTESPEDR